MKKHSFYILLLLLVSTVIFCACKQKKDDLPSTTQEQGENEEEENTVVAKIVSVSPSGSENNYTFAVGISSPDTGCDQYADWWEVIAEDGELIYRRILGHSHVNEQPFVRSGGTVAIAENQIVFIRAHMNEAGYGTQVFKGSVVSGFETFETANGFLSELESVEPLPTGCAF